LLYEKGQGVSLDYVNAYIWYSRAMAAGLKVAGERRRSLTHLLTPEQLDQANTLLEAEASQPRTLQQQSSPRLPRPSSRVH
jgi:TPR repeat protein